MKTSLLFAGLILLCLTCYGQVDYGFGEGIIVTKQGDTIKCFVEMAVTYESKIAYKKAPQGEKLSIPSSDIKSLTTPYKYWENIQVGKKEKLMSLAVDGDAQLFNHVTINPGQSSPMAGGTYTMNNAPTVIYMLKKNQVFYEIRKKDFKATIAALLSDCPTVINKVNNKEYKFDDIEKVISEYNSCR